MSRFHDEMTLGEARNILRELVYEGHKCPLCTQFAKVYRFKINAAISRALILMYKAGGTDWVEVPQLGLPGGHFAKLRFWGLIEKPPELVREDGSSRVGIWRVTALGQEWAGGRTRVPMYALIYNNRCLGVEGDRVTIQQALGRRFNYYELMAGV